MSPAFSPLLNIEVIYSLDIFTFSLHLNSLFHMVDAQDVLNDLTVFISG